MNLIEIFQIYVSAIMDIIKMNFRNAKVRLKVLKKDISQHYLLYRNCSYIYYSFKFVFILKIKNYYFYKNKQVCDVKC